MSFRSWSAVGAVAALVLVTASSRLQAQGGTISGTVTAVVGGTPLAEARVLVLGTSVAATTSQDGKYTLRNVPAGTANLQVLRVGYQSLKKSVAVTAGATATADFALTVAVAQLEEIVTTATGQSRKVELGNAVQTLGDVAKQAEQSPITDAAGLLTAKAPGVIVLPGSTLGGPPTIRVRGVSSISLSNAPIWVVDGTRIATNDLNSGTNTSFSLNNMLNPDDIEDIEIVKGPSAATLYGTDAANGVVVVTTKKGRAGAARWNYGAEYGIVDDRTDYPSMYANWGHTTANPAKNVRCQIATMAAPGQAPATPTQCISDSVTSYNLLADPSRTFIHNGNRKEGTAQVSGGNEAIRYYASGTMNNEIGPIQMPSFEVARFNASGVDVRDEWYHPLAQQQVHTRANISASVSPKFDLSANAGFSKADNRIEPESSLIIALLYTGLQNYGYKGCPGAVAPCGLDKIPTQATYPGATAGVPLNDYLQWAPGDIMQYTSESDVQRMTGSFNASWRPFAWMSNEGTIGLDLASTNFFHLCRLNECPPQSQTARVGNVTDNRRTDRNFSAKVTSTGSWNAKPWLNLKTSVGGDYTNIESDFVNEAGQNLPPGASTVAAAASFLNISEQQPTATKTLGVYLQEVAGFRDRLFLTLAARSDQNSAFGSNFQSVFYPKVGVSYLISDENFFPHYSWMNEMRLRFSYGVSGVQPGRTQGLVLFSPGSVAIDSRGSTTGTDVPSLVASNPGNANLKPERSGEYETGFESKVLNNRATIDYTFYRKTTHDALISVPIAGSAGASVASLLQNVGSTRNTGHELQINMQLIDMKRIGWDMTLSGSHNTSTVIDLGIDPATSVARILGAGGQTENRAGDPINSQWYRPYTYNDKNHDGILQWNTVDSLSEVHVDSVLHNYGTGIPRDLFSIQTGVDLFGRRLRLQTLFDYKGGYSTQDGMNNFQCNSTPFSCRETQDPTAPLAQQARAIAKTLGSNLCTNAACTGQPTNYKTGAGYFINGQFWKWRELSAIAQMPNVVARAIRADPSSSFVFGIRNIHTFTKFTGLDPEANYGVAGNELQNEFQTAAAPTYFTFRLNLKY
jgi:TonB-linked SusC/RagA family outer membrane protein